MENTLLSPVDPTPEAPAEGFRLIWDWPTRIFHWTFAGCFGGAFVIAVLSSEHSSSFLVHMLFGLVLLVAILLRLVWGVVGSRPSRFGSFLFSPGKLFTYLRSALSGRDAASPGHNPGSAYAAFAMLLLGIGLGASGLAQGQGLKGAEEIHEVFAYAMLAVVIVHVLGLAWHRAHHHENIALSMVHGKRPIPANAAIGSSRPMAGLTFLLILGCSAFLLGIGLDTSRKQVSLPGLDKPIPLGEAKSKDPGKIHRQHEDDD